MRELSVKLDDRVLRFDGVSVISPEQLVDALLRGADISKLRLTEHTDETILFNDNAGEELQLVKPEPVRLDFAWKLPEPHLSMDLQSTVVARAVDRLKELNYPEDVHLRACQRIQDELDEIERRGMVEFVKTIIYILDTFRQKGVVWGVGRGSSCASYILFILGLHSVDPVLYDVPLSEFFHD